MTAGCPLSGKVRFPSEQAAVQRLREIQARPEEWSIEQPTAVYLCPCEAWHLTKRLEVPKFLRGKVKREPELRVPPCPRPRRSRKNTR